MSSTSSSSSSSSSTSPLPTTFINDTSSYEIIEKCGKCDELENKSVQCFCLDDPEASHDVWGNPEMQLNFATHIFCIILGVLGNVVTLLAMTKGDRKARSATNSFLISLAVSSKHIKWVLNINNDILEKCVLIKGVSVFGTTLWLIIVSTMTNVDIELMGVIITRNHCAIMSSPLSPLFSSKAGIKCTSSL